MIHSFKYRGAFLVLDVESGAVHEVDKVSYEIIKSLELGNDVYALPYSISLIDEVLTEIDELRNSGVFDSPSPTEVPAVKGGYAIKSLCLNVAHDCNLRCAYCFAETGEFHGGRMLMPFEVAKAALNFLIANSGGRHNLEVDLFGGEPLMNFDVIKQLVSYGRELEEKHSKTIHFTITTNGLALNDEIIEYINKEMHNVVISIDGRRTVHDRLRITPNNRGSYDIIVPNAVKLVSGRSNLEHYVRGTFTAKNLDFTEDVRALVDLGFDQISIEPVVLAESDPNAINSDNIEQALNEYDKLSEYCLEQKASGKPLNFFHFAIDLDHSPCLSKRTLGCGAGVEYVAVTPNGDIYPCHQFVGDSNFLMGNVLDGEHVSEDIRMRFASCNVFTKEKCSSCWAKYFCSGGCAANAHKLNGSIFDPPELSCRLLKKRTELAIGMQLLGSNEA